jgi:hypothetical protein
MTILPASWIVGVAVAALGLLGLSMAAHGTDIGVELFGSLLSIFAVLFVFWLIKRSYDAHERQRAD